MTAPCLFFLSRFPQTLPTEACCHCLPSTWDHSPQCGGCLRYRVQQVLFGILVTFCAIYTVGWLPCPLGFPFRLPRHQPFLITHLIEQSFLSIKHWSLQTLPHVVFLSKFMSTGFWVSVLWLFSKLVFSGCAPAASTRTYLFPACSPLHTRIQTPKLAPLCSNSQVVIISLCSPNFCLTYVCTYSQITHQFLHHNSPELNSSALHIVQLLSEPDMSAVLKIVGFRQFFMPPS